MLYSLTRIFHNLKRHFPVYLLFSLQFAIGILILCSTLNVLITLQKDLKAKQEEMEVGNALEIITNAYAQDDIPSIPTSMNQCMGVSYDIYLKLAEKYKEDFTFQYGVDTSHISAAVFNTEDESFQLIPPINVWFVNEEVFQDYFDTPMNRDTMYAGENAYAALLQIKEWTSKPEQYSFMDVPDNVLWVENGEYTVAHKDVYQLSPMPPTEKKDIKASLPSTWFMHNADAVEGVDYVTVTLSDCVFLPLSSLPTLEEFIDTLPWQDEEFKQSCGTMGPYHNLLKVQFKNQNFKTETLSELLSYLMHETHMTETGMTVEFTLDESLLEQLQSAENIKAAILDYLIMSVSILLVVMLGTTGLFLIFLYRRKKQMAVAVAYGSTKHRLFGELFTEIFLITGFGAALGLWALRFTTEFSKSFYAEAVFQSSCIVIAFILAVLTALFTSTLAFAGVGEIAPAKILKEFCFEPTHKKLLNVFVILSVAVGFLFPVYSISYMNYVEKNYGTPPFQDLEHTVVADFFRKPEKENVTEETMLKWSNQINKAGFFARYETIAEYNGASFVYNVSGCNSDFLEISNTTLVSGRFPTKAEMETGARVCLATSTSGHGYKIGTTVTIGGTDFEIIGIFRDIRLYSGLLIPYQALYPMLDEKPIQHKAYLLTNVEPDIGMMENRVRSTTSQMLFVSSGADSEIPMLERYQELITKDFKNSFVILLFSLISFTLIIAGKMLNEQYLLGVKTAVGATKFQLFLDLLFRNFLLIQTGVAITLLAYQYLFLLNDSDSFGLFDGTVVAITEILCFLMTLFSTCVALLPILKRPVTELFQNSQD